MYSSHFQILASLIYRGVAKFALVAPEQETRVSGGGVERGLIELLERDAVSTRGGAIEQWDQAHENAKKR